MRAIYAGVLMAMSGAVCAADLARPSSADDIGPFTPTAPLGFASEFPRSPLEDAFVRARTQFATARQAQDHCPQQIVVKVETLSNITKPAKLPGDGVFMCQTDAAAEGDRPR
ncbi:hypothetical protein [Lichenifustis flavocetrariae]|uniref:UrcA family protein n=1 Tax=Lichenifustis flavocetrariae TaxID=2949735 RepID=A0AA42CNT7_9HYPH|nr:hypothetical protein [Lichenifustis flavocetrariae]MCW6513156.1 hypothetical protein [Lichenifustis flavocetrariae]